MKFPGHIRSYVLHVCAFICLAAVVAPVCAQNPRPPAILELKTCGRELQVFENGAVVQSRDGAKTERSLSEKRMRKLRQVIARGPCEEEWQRPLPPSAAPGDNRVVPATVYLGDCMGSVLSFGAGLQEVWVTRRYPGFARSTVVYVLCEHARASYKKMAKRYYRDYVKRSWRRFLADVTATAGDKSILKDCNCWQ